MSEPSPPSQPGGPTFTNVKPTTLTISWTAPTDNGGDSNIFYEVDRYLGDSATGTPVKSAAGGLTQNVTGLTAGATYTFDVFAINGSPENNGKSPAAEGTVQMLAGASVREDGIWHVAVPWVRYEGHWKMAVPWIRVAGVWQQTH